MLIDPNAVDTVRGWAKYAALKRQMGGLLPVLHGVVDSAAAVTGCLGVMTGQTADTYDCMKLIPGLDSHTLLAGRCILVN